MNFSSNEFYFELFAKKWKVQKCVLIFQGQIWSVDLLRNFF